MNELYSFEKAQEEATILQDKIKSGEVTSYEDAEEKLRIKSLHSNIEMEGILKKYDFSPIKKQLEEDFPDIRVLLGWNGFCNKLKEFYKNDRDAIGIINSRLEEIQKHISYWSKAKDISLNEQFSKEEFLENKREQAKMLYYITSFLKGTQLDKEKPIENLKEILKDKKILVLGDDTGSLSEVLRQYGAESYGIEIDKFKILIAHSGIFAKNGNPQLQVIEGDLGTLFKGKDKETLDEFSLKYPEEKIQSLIIANKKERKLMEKLKELGPFDMIVSDNVFNFGSGIEKVPLEAIGDDYHSAEKGTTANAERLILKYNCDTLLKENGLQLHASVDEEYLFPKKYRGKLDGMILIPKNEN